jgi:hypothetical protein
MFDSPIKNNETFSLPGLQNVIQKTKLYCFANNGKFGYKKIVFGFTTFIGTCLCLTNYIYR